jgi:hypothetical protein
MYVCMYVYMYIYIYILAAARTRRKRCHAEAVEAALLALVALKASCTSSLRPHALLALTAEALFTCSACLTRTRCNGATASSSLEVLVAAS